MLLGHGDAADQSVGREFEADPAIEGARRFRSMTSEPKPRPSGLATGGPPVSFHSSRMPPPFSIGRCAQMMSTWLRPGTDSAPNFAALVEGSCRARP